MKILFGAVPGEDLKINYVLLYYLQRMNIQFGARPRVYLKIKYVLLFYL